MKRAWLVAIVALAACPRGKPKPPPSDPNAGASDSDLGRRMQLIAELQDEILTSYERDELPETETTMIAPQVGPARIGVGPGDAFFGEGVRKFASSRWPLYVEAGTPTTVRSKRLRIHLSMDKRVSAAWMSDELSWRITMCNRTAVIPLRMTALYARDGDRWVQVFEHLSFGRMPQPTNDGALRGNPLVDRDNEECPPGRAHYSCPIIDHPKRELSDELSRILQGLVSAQSTRIQTVVASGARDGDPTKPAPTVLFSPDPDGEWNGSQEIQTIRLIDGKVTFDDRRVGTVSPGGNYEKATIAYWVGNLVADLRHHPGTMASKVRLRGTFVFELREGKWILVQGHISQPIDDIDLAQLVYGTALISEKPLQITCDDGRRGVVQGATIPAAAPSGPAPAAGSR